MNDKSFAEVPKESVSLEDSRLFNESFDFTKTTPEQFKTITADSRSNQALESSGALPRIELFDSAAADHGDGKGLSSDGTAFPQPYSGDVGTTRSNFSEFSLVESGKIVKEIPPSYYGDSTETHYDNGSVRHQFSDGTTIELRPNHMTVAEDQDHNLTIKLPSGEYVERSPKFPDKEIKTTDVKDDGTVIYKYKDGTQETILPPPDNGREVNVTVKLPNGKSVERSPSERGPGVEVTEVSVDVDGTVWFHYSNGEKEKIAPDNSRTVSTELGTTITDPDGTQRFENLDGTWGWHDPSTGEWKGGDKNGTVRWEVDKNGKRTDYDENGRKVSPKRKH